MIARWIAHLFNERFWQLSPNFAIQGAGRWYDEDEPGASPARRVRILLPVCSSCNNGWMSGLESAVKPLLSRLIVAEPTTIGDVDADVLATWAMKTLVNAVFERHRRASALVPFEFRSHLREHGRPPPGVALVVFRVDGLDTKVRTRVKEVPIRKWGGRQVDTAVVSTALIGRVAVQMASHLLPGTPHPTIPSLATAGMTLWPPEVRKVPAGSAAFAWPPDAAVTGDAEFEAIADPDDDNVRAWMP